MSRRISPWALLGGAVVGVGATALTALGAPGNHGLSPSCFLRDATTHPWILAENGVGSFRIALLGLILGAAAAARVRGEFHAQGGSPIWLSATLGAATMLGAGIFVGCPTKLHLRLAGGDPVALVGLAGLVLGLFIASRLLRRGYDAGRIGPAPTWHGRLIPITALVLLAATIIRPSAFGWDQWAEARPGFAPPLFALGIGLAVGAVAQVTRLCFTSGWMDVFLARRTAMLGVGVGAVTAAFVAIVVLGVTRQWPLGETHWAHREWVWAVAGMMLVGLAAGLVQGCPMRMLVRASQGDRDAAVYLVSAAAAALVMDRTAVTVGTDLRVSIAGKIAVVAVFAGLLLVARLRFDLDS